MKMSFFVTPRPHPRFLAGAAQYSENLELSIAPIFSNAGRGKQKSELEIICAYWPLPVTFAPEKSIKAYPVRCFFESPILFQFNFYHFRIPIIQISSTQGVIFPPASHRME